MLSGHGGNIKEISGKYKIPAHKIVDFSSNINPLGISPRVRKIISGNPGFLTHYPDPESRSARQRLSEYWGVDKDNFILGNGSNELIHLLPRVLKCSRALIYQPTFSEYELSLILSGIKPVFILAQENEDFRIDIKKIIKCASKVDLIILCNPNNPTGYLFKNGELLKLAQACKKSKTYLLVDEVFMDFVEEEEKYSLLKEASQQKHILVLRSLTKFFSLPGLRAGYLVADKGLIGKIRLFQPTWSVNSFVQEIITRGALEPEFVRKTKSYIAKEREFLFNNLKSIRGIHSYYPAANFIFSKIEDKRFDAKSLFLRLIKYGIIIRDCSNFQGLDSRFFRVAVRKRKENNYFVESLKRIFG